MIPILFTVLFIAAAAVAQEDCPNPAIECPDNCGGAQCGRFLNAECRENPCHGLCTPNFFRKGRNVTDRCDVERCGDKDCPGERQCIEETVPASCLGGRPQCRQYIRARCVLPPPPTDCSQISCGPGMFCRERKRREGVTCARARRCNQLECDQGFTCTETEAGPMCAMSKPFTSCEEAGCPEGTLCSEFSIPTRKLSVAQCIRRDIAETLATFESGFSCDPDDMFCDAQTEGCAEVFEDGRLLIFECNAFNCTDDTSCPSDRVCREIPDFLRQMFQIPFDTVCNLPDIVFSETGCASLTNPCPPGLACHDIISAGVTTAIGCGISAPTYSGSSCAELGCPAPLECYERIIESRGGLARCFTEKSIDVFVENVFGDI